MRNHSGIRYALALFVWCAYLWPVSAQQADSTDVILHHLMERDFGSIEPTYKDSALVNTLLKEMVRCTQTRNDSALFFADKAFVLAEKAGLLPQVTLSLERKGQYFMNKEDFFSAISCFINAIKIEEKRKDQRRVADLNDELASVYYYQEIFGKALVYNQNALSIYQKLKDTINIAKSLSHLGSLFLSREYCEHRSDDQKQVDQLKALDYYQQSIILCQKKGDLAGIANINMNIGTVYNRMNKPETALGYVQKALSYYRENNDMEKISETLYTLGFIYNRLLKFDMALQCFNDSKEISQREKYSNGIQFLYHAIAQTYDNLKDYKNARNFYVKYMIIRDSVYNNEKSRQIFELETKYQAEKKQQQIEKLTLAKRQRTFVIYFLIVSLLFVSLMGRLYFRNIKIKKIIVEQNLVLKEKQLLELQKERQLVAAKSVLQGEETERARLACDLHDGLGGLLAGVKLKLSFMKENTIITSENLAHFNHALDLLDLSITEMRRVAHNLMPETLVHYGLQVALNDFIKQVSPEGFPKITFNTFGDDLRFDKELEITVYRLTQELVTNSIKHAKAKQIDIQLFTEKERICVQVNDNGIGFDPKKLDPTKKGNGQKNIHDRVTAFNGRFEIISQLEKGTESTIEFLIS